MQTQFKAAMHKLELLGQPATLVDCSDVIPVPASFSGPAVFPATFNMSDIQQAVSHFVCSFKFRVSLTQKFTVCYRAVPHTRDSPRPRDFRSPGVSLDNISLVYSPSDYLSTAPALRSRPEGVFLVLFSSLVICACFQT